MCRLETCTNTVADANTRPTTKAADAAHVVARGPVLLIAQSWRTVFPIERDNTRDRPGNVPTFPEPGPVCARRRNAIVVTPINQQEVPMQTETVDTTEHVRTAGLWALGGATWLAAGLINGGTYEAIWIAADLLLLAGLIGLAQLAPHGTKRGGKAGFIVAAVGRVAFIAAEVIAAVTGKDENPFLPIGAILTVIGMVLLGVAVYRAKRWDTPARLAPLAMGVYPFVAMFPIVVATGGPSTVAIASWGVPTALLGLAAWQARPHAHDRNLADNDPLATDVSAANRRK